MSRFVNACMVFIALVFFVMVLKTLQSFIRPFAVAIILTLLIMPILRYFEQRKIPFLVTFSGIFIIFILACIAFIFILSQSILSFNEEIPLQQAKLQAMVVKVNSFLSQYHFGDATLSLSQFISTERIGNALSSSVSSLLKGIQLIFSEVFAVLLFMLFLIPSYKIFLRDVEQHFGATHASKVKKIFFKIEKSSRDYLYSKSILSLGTALTSAFVLFLFKADLILILAFLIFILNFIPNFGSIIAVGIALLSYAISNGFGWQIIVLGILLTFIQLLFDSILGPKVTGNTLKLSPVVVLLGLFFWGWTWGVVGMFLAIPLLSIMKIILESIESTKTIVKFMG